MSETWIADDKVATTVMIYSKLSSTDKLGMSADKSWKLRSRSYTAVTTGKHLSKVDAEKALWGEWEPIRASLEVHKALKV